MWNGQENNVDLLTTWIRHTPSMKLASGVDGKIFWANDSFCEWSGYTLAELKRMTWIQLSVNDGGLEADLAELKTLDQYKTSYSVTKQYIPKNDRPQWGKLSVVRYPVVGEIQYCLCTWEPLKNGAATALAMAIEAVGKLETQVDGMKTELKGFTSQSDGDRALLFISRMIQQHPKTALTLVVAFLALIGANNVVAVMQRLGLVSLPTIHTQQDLRTGQLMQADGIADKAVRPALTVSHPSGMKIEWHRQDERPMTFEEAETL